MTTLPVWFEIGSLSLLTLLLIADLALVAKRPHVPSAKESGLWVGFYVTLALIFALVMLLLGGGEVAGQFVAALLCYPLVARLARKHGAWDPAHDLAAASVAAACAAAIIS